MSQILVAVRLISEYNKVCSALNQLPFQHPISLLKVEVIILLLICKRREIESVESNLITTEKRYAFYLVWFVSFYFITRAVSIVPFLAIYCYPNL